MKRSPGRRAGFFSPATVFLSLLVILAAATVTLPPPSGRIQASGSPSGRVSRLYNDVQSESLDGLARIRKVYRLPENTTVAPEPDPDGFGFTTDPAVVAETIEQSAELLEGQMTVWTPDTPCDEEYGINYYRDDSILVIVWHERRGSMILSFAEVMIGDASQFRRKLVENTYGSGSYRFPTELAEECNAVLGLSADFYKFQRAGIHVYDRMLCRFDDVLDVCWINGDGDMILTPAHTFTAKEQAEEFIRENDILFTLSFGPIMVMNGENVTPVTYFQGEATEGYPRCCLGQVGPRHYLAMTVKGSVRVREAAEYMVAKGVESCYALDGGQSGTIAMQGVMLNPSMFGEYHQGQRPQSDIIYFATAIPEAGRSGRSDGSSHE